VVARDVLRHLRAKIGFLLRVGLGYLTLGRQARTLSGGEAQRINLANQLGAQLVGTLYVLDEPSIGLHARDTARLAELCRELAALGNTVVIVEHDRSLIEAADYVIEMGPGSGERGGTMVFAGTQAELLADPRSLTARYLSGRESIPLPPRQCRGRPFLRAAPPPRLCRNSQCRPRKIGPKDLRIRRPRSISGGQKHSRPGGR